MERHTAATSEAIARSYVRRPPEHGVLHRVVCEHLQSFLWELDRQNEERGTPYAGVSQGHIRANKPKALSAGTTAELGTKKRSDGRAVLFNKTLPCPNKLGPTLTHAVTRSALRVTRSALTVTR